jgi:hypothetical protein
MRGHLDAARAAQAHAEGERDAAVTNAKIAADEIATLRQRFEEQTAEHQHQLEQRDMEYSRAITAAHAMADRAAREEDQRLGRRRSLTPIRARPTPMRLAHNISRSLWTGGPTCTSFPST